ncbi:MAG: retropepsin-like aspartic protease [Pyrinomonadaceae bacterium]
MGRATVILPGVFFALTIGSWAVPNAGAAHSAFHSQNSKAPRNLNSSTLSLPAPVRFREEKDRGLLVRAWINDRGPFTVAVDTGAGLTIVSDSLARQAGLNVTQGRPTVLTGLSGREVTARHAVINRIALGDPGNVMPARIQTAIAATLPSGIDVVLDPTDTYAPFGYSIDLPNGRIAAFDPKSDGLNPHQPPPDGAVVPWLRNGQSNRPFVRLGDGRLALVDTGSNLGLAISAILVGNRSDARTGSSRDLGGGTFRSTRVAPSTVTIGALVLNGVPTDILSGVETAAPVILGRDALYPFKISFDPLRRLIEIAPSMQDRQ